VLDRELNELRVQAGKWSLENMELNEFVDMWLEFAEWKEQNHVLQREFELLRRIPNTWSVEVASIRRQYEIEISMLKAEMARLQQ
jgi:hypothetical protein